MCGYSRAMDARQRDICREFFSSSHRKLRNDSDEEDALVSQPDTARSNISSSDGDPDEVAFIDASHLSDSPRSDRSWSEQVPRDYGNQEPGYGQVSRDHGNQDSDYGQVSGSYGELSDGECDVLVSLPRQQLEYQNSQYFHQDDAFVDTNVSPNSHRGDAYLQNTHNYNADDSPRPGNSHAREASKADVPDTCLRGRSASCTSDRKYKPRPPTSNHLRKSRSVESSSVTEDTEDSGYAESSICLSGRLTHDSGTDSIGLDSLCSTYSDPDKLETASIASSSSERTHSGRMLNRRQFHQSNFVRYRYPSQFHSIEPNTSSVTKSSKPSKKTRFQLPPSLKPNTRYSKEPLVQRCQAADSGKRQWPKPPRYPPRARHTGVECQIIKLVDKLDIGVQCSPSKLNSSCQATAITRDSHTQYPRVKHKEAPTQTVIKGCRDQGSQIRPETRSRMVDTDVTVSYSPNSLLKPHICTKCGLLEEAQNVNFWVSSNLPQK